VEVWWEWCGMWAMRGALPGQLDGCPDRSTRLPISTIVADLEVIETGSIGIMRFVIKRARPQIEAGCTRSRLRPLDR